MQERSMKMPRVGCIILVLASDPARCDRQLGEGEA